MVSEFQTDQTGHNYVSLRRPIGLPKEELVHFVIAFVVHRPMEKIPLWSVEVVYRFVGIKFALDIVFHSPDTRLMVWSQSPSGIAPSWKF